MSHTHDLGNVDLVRESLAAFNANDLDACLAHAAPDLVMHLAELPEPIVGQDAWREGVGLLRRAFPDFRIEIEDVFGAEDRVAARLTMHGTHEGDYLGIPATGRKISYVSHEIYRFDDGRIAEEWICSDTASLFRQLA